MLSKVCLLNKTQAFAREISGELGSFHFLFSVPKTKINNIYVFKTIVQIEKLRIAHDIRENLQQLLNPQQLTNYRPVLEIDKLINKLILEFQTRNIDLFI